MNCPKCSTETETINSRLRKDDVRKRRRVCSKCGYRFTTLEVDENEYSQLKKDKKKLVQLVGRISPLFQ